MIDYSDAILFKNVINYYFSTEKDTEIERLKKEISTLRYEKNEEKQSSSELREKH